MNWRISLPVQCKRRYAMKLTIRNISIIILANLALAPLGRAEFFIATPDALHKASAISNDSVKVFHNSPIRYFITEGELHFEVVESKEAVTDATYGGIVDLPVNVNVWEAKAGETNGKLIATQTYRYLY